MSAGATKVPRWMILDSVQIRPIHKGRTTMRINSYITTLLAAGAAAFAIAAAPMAAAES